MPTASKTAATFAAAVMAATAVVGPAAAQDTNPQPLPANFQTAAAGSPVTMDVYNVSPALVEAAAKYLNDAGCPTTINPDGFVDGVEVQTGEKTEYFDDPGAAANWALKWCLEKS